MTDKITGMNEVIENMIAEELAEANCKYPMFHSWKEAYAVILEEAEEAAECMEIISEEGIGYLWGSIRMKNVEEEVRVCNVEAIKKFAVRGIQELVQVAAMCDKTIESQKIWGCNVSEENVKEEGQ